ncbi:MAG: Ig-like domain-containing protein, partial [Candidatus Hadarchaeales archaeon]
ELNWDVRGMVGSGLYLAFGTGDDYNQEGIEYDRVEVKEITVTPTYFEMPFVEEFNTLDTNLWDYFFENDTTGISSRDLGIISVSNGILTARPSTYRGGCTLVSKSIAIYRLPSQINLRLRCPGSGYRVLALSLQSSSSLALNPPFYWRMGETNHLYWGPQLFRINGQDVREASTSVVPTNTWLEASLTLYPDRIVSSFNGVQMELNWDVRGMVGSGLYLAFGTGDDYNQEGIEYDRVEVKEITAPQLFLRVPAEIESNATVQLIIELKDIQGRGLPARVVKLEASGGYVVPQVITDDRGIAIATYTAPQLNISTRIVITAIFEGDGFFVSNQAFIVVIPSASVWIENLRESMEQLRLKIENLSQMIQQLSEAIIQGRVGASIRLELKNGEVSTKKEFENQVSIICRRVKVGREIQLEVNSERRDGRVVVVNVEKEILRANSYLVFLDGQPISLADNYEDVLDLSDTTPEYLVLQGALGTQFLISIPSFSTHTITIRPAEGAPILIPVITAAGIALVTLVLIFVWRTRKHQTATNRFGD